MKIRFLMMVMMAALLPGRAEENPPSYVLVAPEGMDDAPVERVRDWMARNLFYGVDLVRVPAWEPGTAEAQLDAVSEIVDAEGIVTVVMAPSLEGDAHALVRPEGRIGIMNVGLLAPEYTEQTLRRLDRQAIRIVGFGLGIPPQPIPFSALYPYQDLSELDQIGRGFAPPDMGVYRLKLIEAGIPLSEAAREVLPILKPTPAPEAEAPPED